jgi:hypothetical protein
MEKIDSIQLLQSVFLKNGWAWEPHPHLADNLNVKYRNGLLLFNYNDKRLVPQHHPVLARCRGLVVDEEGRVLNYPFDRFFNDFSEVRAALDWQNAIVQEKVDGTFVSVFSHRSGWEVTTRGDFYSDGQKGINFAILFRTLFSKFDLLDPNYCWFFELITKKTKTITRYDREMVYLLGARSLQDFGEVDHDTLDQMAGRMQVERPRRFSASDAEGCRALFASLREDEEGFVVVDRSFRRIKVKQESYFELSRLPSLNDQDLFEIVLGFREVDEETLTRPVDLRMKLEEMRSSWLTLNGRVAAAYREIEGIKDRKAFAEAAAKYPFRPLLFVLKDGRTDGNRKLKWEVVSTWL